MSAFVTCLLIVTGIYLVSMIVLFILFRRAMHALEEKYRELEAQAAEHAAEV